MNLIRSKLDLFHQRGIFSISFQTTKAVTSALWEESGLIVLDHCVKAPRSPWRPGCVSRVQLPKKKRKKKTVNIRLDIPFRFLVSSDRGGKILRPT